MKLFKTKKTKIDRILDRDNTIKVLGNIIYKLQTQLATGKDIFMLKISFASS